MNERPNPFRPGAGLVPPYLAGRESELDLFNGMLRDVRRGIDRNVLMYGPRGVGKTTLLMKFADMCAEQNVLPVPEYQFGHAQVDPNKFMATTEYAIRRAIESGPRPVGRQAVPLINHEMPRSCKEDKELKRCLSGYLDSVWKVVDSLGYEGVLLLLDEFHTIKDVKKNGWCSLSDFLGSVCDAQAGGCRYSLVMSGRPALPENIKMFRPYGMPALEHVKVPNISKGGTEAAIVKPLEGTGLSFTSKLLDTMFDDTGGYPYFVQLFASEVIRRVDKARIGVEEYRRVRGALIRWIYRNFFDGRMEDLSVCEKNALYCMSELPEGCLRFSSIRERMGRNGGLSSLLGRLKKKEMIRKHGRGLYTFNPPLLGSYLRDTVPTTESKCSLQHHKPRRGHFSLARIKNQ